MKGIKIKMKKNIETGTYDTDIYFNVTKEDLIKALELLIKKLKTK